MEGLINVELITEFIKTNKLTIKEFCNQCKISRSQLSKILKGENFKLISLFRIAKRLNIEVYKMFN